MRKFDVLVLFAHDKHEINVNSECRMCLLRVMLLSTLQFKALWGLPKSSEEIQEISYKSD